MAEELQADLDAQNEAIRLQQVTIEQQQSILDALNKLQEQQVQNQIDLIREIARTARGE